MEIRPWMLAFAAAGLAYALQLFWLTGLFLMMLAGPIWPGVLVNAAMAMLAMDCFIGKTARWLIALPLAFFLFGIGLSAMSWLDASALARDLETRQVRTETPFNAASQALVIANDPLENSLYENLQGELQGNFQIDTVYTTRADGATVATLVTPKAQCPDRVNSSVSGVITLGMRTWRGFAVNACLVSLPRSPKGAPITIRSAKSKERWGMFDAEILETRIDDGAHTAKTVTAATRVFPPIPLFIAGCALDSGAARWRCSHMPWTFSLRVGGSDGLRADARTRTRDVARILGLTGRAATIVKPGGYLISPQTHIEFAAAPLVVNPAGEAARLESETLARFFRDLPALIEEPERATEARAFIYLPASPALVERHMDMIVEGAAALAPDISALDLRRALADALVVAPTGAFESRARRLLELGRDGRIFIKSPGLITRMGDLGAPAVPILVAELTRPESGVYSRGQIAFGDLRENQMAAALGLCRVGASANTPEVREALRGMLATPGYIGESAFLALLRIGDRAGAEMYVPRNPPGVTDSRLRPWRDATLSSVTPNSPRSACFTRQPYLMARFPRGD